ncbi:hypothetical protein BHM03_00011765, partial [Ensete ventricosum]
NHYKDKLLIPSTCSYWPTVALFETIACLTNPELPWNCSVIDYLSERKVFSLLRCIILAGVVSVSYWLLVLQVFWSKGLGRYYIHQMANFLPSHAGVLPDDIVREYPGHACLLGNLLEVAGVVLSDPSSTYHTVSTYQICTF